MCQPLTACKTNVRLKDRSPIDGGGGTAAVALFDPLQEYIIQQSTRYTDRICWAWGPCGANDYVEQLPVDDGTGFLVKPQICKRLSAARKTPPQQYLLVDGSATRDRDNVWVDCTSCYKLNMYQASSCTPTQDAVCKPYTLCDARYEYLLRKGNLYNDAICAPKTLCSSSTSRGMYQKVPAVDSVSFYVNGTDAICEPYSTCPDGTFMSFAGDDTRDVQCSPCPVG